MNKFKEDYLTNLAETVKSILKRYGDGEKLNDDNLALIILYLKELKQLERVTFLDKFVITYKQLQSMLKVQPNNNDKEEI